MDKSVKLEFNYLVLNWRYEIRHISSIDMIIEHPLFKKIIKLGKKIIPLILKELIIEPSHLIIALAEITNENPIHPNHKGDLEKMTEDWIEWGKKCHLIMN